MYLKPNSESSKDIYLPLPEYQQEDWLTSKILPLSSILVTIPKA